MQRARGERQGRWAGEGPAAALRGWGAAAVMVLALFHPAVAPAAGRGAQGSAAPAQAVARRPAPRLEVAPPPELRAEDLSAAAALLVDAASGEILFALGARERRAPASLTKVMTAVVVLERARLAEQVVVSRNAPEAGGHAMGLRPGQRISVGDLLAALMIRSANDAAVALAEHVGRSVAGFAALMNAKARALGMTDTRFQNPHGLDSPDHYTTAYDLAILTRYAFQSPTFAELVRTRQRVITVRMPGTARRQPGRLIAKQRVLRSHNRLLDALEGADGVKTGFTSEAGRCLVASAQRGGRRLIAVLLNDPRRWEDAALLLEYGFGVLGSPAVRPDGAPADLMPPRRAVPEETQVGG